MNRTVCFLRDALRRVLFILFLPLSAAALPDPEAFVNPPPDRTRVGAVIPLTGSDEAARETAMRQLERAKSLAFGFVLFDLPAETEGFWETWQAVTKRAKQLRLPLGFTDFALLNETSAPTASVQFSRHINRVLFQSQTNLPETYGTTLIGYHFPGHSVTNPPWPSTAADTNLWRETYAVTLRDLVQESGLDAGLSVEHAPLPPEEVGFFFKQPIFPLATNAWECERNTRAGGGARTMARLDCWGQLPVESPAALVTNRQAFARVSLLHDGATRILFPFPEGISSDDETFRALQSLCTFFNRCQWLLAQGDPPADFLYIGENPPDFLVPYALDRAAPAMLQSARPKQRDLLFPSGRRYPRLLVQSGALREHPGLAALLNRYRTAGITVGQTDTDDASPPFPVWRDAADLPIPPPYRATPDNTNLLFRITRRKPASGTILLVSNTTGESGTLRVDFPDPPKGSVECWNPEDGTRVPLPLLPPAGVELPLPPFASRFIVTP